MIFLDTDIISFYFNGNITVRDNILKILDSGKIGITIMNEYEILKGLKWRNNKKKEQQFYEFLNDVNIYGIDEDIIKTSSDIYADLRKHGITVSDADILIAATVINNDGVLITNNIKHYENIKQLKLGKWL
jgi:predicted nucleic acid-binding protein